MKIASNKPYPKWVKYGCDKAWAVGYDKDFVEGSTVVRTVVIKVKENLYIVCEAQLDDWTVDSDAKTFNLLVTLGNIQQIAVKSLADNNHFHPTTVRKDLEAIINAAILGIQNAR